MIKYIVLLILTVLILACVASIVGVCLEDDQEDGFDETDSRKKHGIK